MQPGGLPIEYDVLEPWGEQVPEPRAQPGYFTGIPLKRVLAYLVDLVVILAAIGLVWLVFLAFSLLSFGLLSPFLWPGLPLVPLAYHILLIGGERSATWGMRLFNIEVRTWDGRRPGHMQAALMTIVFYVTVAFTGWLILAVALFNERRRTLHDFVCGTIVINNPPLPH